MVVWEDWHLCPLWLCLPPCWLNGLFALHIPLHEEDLNLQRIKIPESGPSHLNHSEQGSPRVRKASMEGIVSGQVWWSPLFVKYM